jgi:hypothetical protein
MIGFLTTRRLTSFDKSLCLLLDDLSSIDDIFLFNVLFLLVVEVCDRIVCECDCECDLDLVLDLDFTDGMVDSKMKVDAVLFEGVNCEGDLDLDLDLDLECKVATFESKTIVDSVLLDGIDLCERERERDLDFDDEIGSFFILNLLKGKFSSEILGLSLFII